MIRKNIKDAIAIYKNGKSVTAIYKGGYCMWQLTPPTEDEYSTTNEKNVKN